jgi:HK97 family phage portal protein
VSFWNNLFTRDTSNPLRAAVSAVREERGYTVSTEETNPGVLSSLGFLGGSVAGMHVNQDSALSFAAVWACVQAISQDLAALPFVIYSDSDGTKQVRKDHPAYRLLNLQANPKQTAFQFRQSMLATVLLRGEAFALIERDGRQSPVALHYKHPDRTEVLERDGRFWYRFDSDQRRLPYADYEVIHLRGLSMSGGRGISVLHAHRKTLGLGLANQAYGLGFYEKGARVDAVMKHPGKFKDAAVAERLRNQFESTYSGAGGNRVLMLEEGIDYEAISMGPKDAEFLNTHKLTNADVARIFRVPLHKINELDSSIKANIEQQAIEYIQNTLQPWAVNTEQEFRLKLFRAAEVNTTKGKHNFNGLMRGDSQARGTYYREMLNTGVMSINDVRDLEEMNPVTGGDERFIQGAMVPLSRINDIIDKQTEPAQPPVTTLSDDDQAPAA